jgi:hypothetical protein
MTEYELPRRMNVARNNTFFADLAVEDLSDGEKFIVPHYSKSSATTSSATTKTITDLTLSTFENKIERRLQQALEHLGSMARGTEEKTPEFGKAKLELLHINELLASNKGKKIGKYARQQMWKLVADKLFKLCPDIVKAVEWVCLIPFPVVFLCLVCCECECVLNCVCLLLSDSCVQAMKVTTPYPVKMGLTGLFLKAVAKYCDRKGMDLDRDLEENETVDTEQILICCW